MIQVKRETVKLIIGFFIIIIFILGTKVISKMWEKGNFISIVTQYPKKTLGIVIDIDQREKLFNQLVSFANSHDFDIHIRQTTPTGDTFNIKITGNSINISGDNVFHPTAYDFYFYDSDPDNPVSEEDMIDLLEDFKKFIGKVPNIRIFDE